MNVRDYKCTTRAGVLKRIAGLENLRMAYLANPYIPEHLTMRLESEIAAYQRQLEDLPLKRKKICL